MKSNHQLFGEIISSYTRAQAFEDGVLIDVSKAAKEAGFQYPVAVTASVWHQYIEWTIEDNEKQTMQDTEGRLWDILCMLRFACRLKKDSDCIFYKLKVVPRDGETQNAKLITLKALIGGGDNSEPVITIMLPKED